MLCTTPRLRLNLSIKPHLPDPLSKIPHCVQYAIIGLKRELSSVTCQHGIVDFTLLFHAQTLELSQDCRVCPNIQIRQNYGTLQSKV